jgi:hypothetical protein
MLSIRSPQDFLAGILFFGIGAVFLYSGASLANGTVISMGPGYVPRILCYLLLAVGAILLVRGLAITGPSAEEWSLRPLFFVVGATLLFAFGLQPLGLVAVIFLTVCLGRLALRETRPVEMLVIATVMSLGSVALFVYALKLNAPLWPQF